ncbi:MAG: M48 family metallopeptidase [Myxococcota bacterium]
MEFEPRLPRDGINVSRRHPLREAAVLAALVGGLVIGVALAGIVAVELIVPRLPPSVERTLFGGLSVLGARSGAEAEAATAPLEALLARLVRHWEEVPYELRIRAVDQSAANAFAFPGGWIGVTTGLLAQIRSENELAFVLAHEIGHFRHRHHLRALGRALVVGAVLGLAGQSTGSGLVGIGPLLAARRFDREQEREADAFGLALVYQEYGHLAGTLDFFERLQKAQSNHESRLLRYLSTHPLSTERTEALGTLSERKGWPTEGPLVPFAWTGGAG